MEYYHQPINDWWISCRDAKCESTLESFELNVRQSLLPILKSGVIEIKDDKLYLVDEAAVFICLHFENLKMKTSHLKRKFQWYELSKQDDTTYLLELLDEKGKVHEITFTNINYEISFYNALDVAFGKYPWQYFNHVAHQILLQNQYLNLKDKDTPLLDFFVSLDDYHLRNINAFIETDILLLSSLKEMEEYDIINEICKPKYQPVFEKLLHYFEEKQAKYPHRQYLNKEEINQYYHNKGYSGSFPHYHKMAPLKKLIMQESYGKSKLIGLKKRVNYYLYVHEYYDHGMNFEIIYARSLQDHYNKKKKKDTNLLDCLWMYDGHRHFSVMESFEKKRDFAKRFNRQIYTYQDYLNLSLIRLEAKKDA